MTRDTNRNASPTSSKDHHMHGTTLARRPRIARPRRLARALAKLAVICVGALGLAAAPALAGECPNEQLRIENNSTRLPQCRAYELVTNPYKEGFAPVQGELPFAFIDGSFAYNSSGNFVNDGLGRISNEYIAKRSAAGWLTESFNPSGPAFTDGGIPAQARSADLRSSLWQIRLPDEAADLASYYLRAPDGTFTRIGPAVNPATSPPGAPGQAGPGRPIFTEGVSADLSHVLFMIEGLYSFSGISPGLQDNLYEYVGTGHESPQYVAVDNAGNQIVPATGSCADGMSTDGRVVFFQLGCEGGSKGQVFARINETTTIEASASACTRTGADPGGACNGSAEPHYAGAASDGSRVFFTTTQQLVNGDTNETNDLYACDIPPGTPTPVGLINPCESLADITGAAADANVQGVDVVSADGSRVYFTATGVLAANTEALGEQAKAGDDNLYVWEHDANHPAGQTTFVSRVPSSGIEGAQTTADGRYLVFNTPGQLVASDTDESRDVYRYDAVTRSLIRISVDTSGAGGNTPGEDVTFGDNAMSADGSTVVFRTNEGLSPADANGTTDVYAWHGGRVSLISSGRLGHDTPDKISFAGVSPSGTDIYFTTTDQLAANDGDTDPDIYDARVDGGFRVVQAPRCSGEECHGALSSPPVFPGLSASALFDGPGSAVPGGVPPANPKPKAQTRAQKLAKALKACRSRHVRKKRAACEKQARRTYGSAR